MPTDESRAAKLAYLIWLGKRPDTEQHRAEFIAHVAHVIGYDITNDFASFRDGEGEGAVQEFYNDQQQDRDSDQRDTYIDASGNTVRVLG